MANKKDIVFEDLKDLGVLRQFSKGFNSEDDFVSVERMSYYTMKYNMHDGKSYFLKYIDDIKGINSVASARLCEKVGILTPPVYWVGSRWEKPIETLQQSVGNIDGINLRLAGYDVEYAKIEKMHFDKFKWQIFYDERYINYLLQLMTPDCLIDLQNMFLVDELRTELDRHVRNYFFYKFKDSEKYEGVIEIDMERMAIYNFRFGTKEDFENFLTTPYLAAIPQQSYSRECYKQRVINLRQLIQDGVLSQSNIDAIINTLQYDFPAEMKKVCKEGKIGLKELNKFVDPIQYLWEYNNENLGKELGL